MEAQGFEVQRFTVRRWAGNLVDADDQAEAERTHVVLDAGMLRLLLATLITAVGAPMAFWRAMSLAIRMGRRSLRGIPFHLIYVAEACMLRRWWRQGGVRHVHVPFGTNSTAVAMLCRVLGGPTYSFTAHGPEEFDMPLSLSLGDKVRHAAFVVAISDFGRSQLYRWADFEDWEKVHVVRCGVDDRFLDAAAPVQDSNRLVCVGRIAEQKGQLLLVCAAARLREMGISFDLTLAGDGPMRSEVESLIAQLHLQDCVHITGWVSGEQVRDALVHARAMVLPSFAEGLPVVIMEALALGRPVVSTYVAGIPELVEPNTSGWLVPAGSVEMLANAMREVLQTPVEMLENMGRHARSVCANGTMHRPKPRGWANCLKLNFRHDHQRKHRASA